MLAPTDYALSIAEAARTLYRPRSLDDTLQTIVEVACNSVPGFDHVGIATMEKKGDVETRAFTGDLVLPLDELQYTLREGPCSRRRSHGTEAVSRLEPAPTSERWPRFVPQSQWRWGVRSQLAVKLYLDEDTLGGLNFYSTTSRRGERGRPGARPALRHPCRHRPRARPGARRSSTTRPAEPTGVIGQALGLADGSATR